MGSQTVQSAIQSAVSDMHTQYARQVSCHLRRCTQIPKRHPDSGAGFLLVSASVSIHDTVMSDAERRYRAALLSLQDFELAVSSIFTSDDGLIVYLGILLGLFRQTFAVSSNLI